MPTSQYMYHKMIGSSNLACTKYVVSIKCYKLNKFDECIETIAGVSQNAVQIHYFQDILKKST